MRNRRQYNSLKDRLKKLKSFLTRPDDGPNRLRGHNVSEQFEKTYNKKYQSSDSRKKSISSNRRRRSDSIRNAALKTHYQPCSSQIGGEKTKNPPVKKSVSKN